MNRYMKPWANDPVFYLFQLSSFRIFYQKEQKHKNSIQKPTSTFVTAHINTRHFMNSNYTFECWKCLQFQIFQLQVSVKVYAYCFNARKSIFEVRYCQPPNPPTGIYELFTERHLFHHDLPIICDFNLKFRTPDV